MGSGRLRELATDTGTQGLGVFLCTPALLFLQAYLDGLGLALGSLGLLCSNLGLLPLHTRTHHDYDSVKLWKATAGCIASMS